MLGKSPFMGMLRLSAARTAISKPTFLTCGRTFSILSAQALRPLSTRSFLERRATLFPALSQRRTLSLGSIFSSKPQGTPSPHVVALITRLEAEANVYPHEVSKQMALFEALIDTNMKSSYELVLTRWEKMCEFDPSSPLLQSPDAFKIYLTCLEKTGQSAAINAAVKRRDDLLTSQGVTIAVAPNTTDKPSQIPEDVNIALSSTDASPAQPPTLPLVTPTVSQVIAQQVLSKSNQLGATPPPPSTADALKLSTSGEPSRSGPMEVTIVERKGAWIPRLVRFLVLVAVSSFFFLVILSVFFENTGFMKAGPRQSQFEPSEGKTVMFSDVHGVDEAKEELEDVVAFLKDPSAFSTLGGKLPKGVLLTGPPGTGKTLLARAVAGEAGVPFFFASGSDFEEMFVGVGAKRVRELFAAARKKQPAIIFIDELDAVGGKRSSRDQQYMKQTLNQLLVEMDGFQQSEGVIVIAATNFPESLDQALVRPGRFDRNIAVPLPDVRGRVHILQHHLRGITVGTDVDPKILARGTPGFSGADLENMVNQAAIHASKLHATEVSIRHFEWAKDRILMGAERRSQFLNDKSKLATAYHEGGHALVALYTDGAMPLHKVTCVPRGHALGYTSQLPLDDRTSISFKEYLAEIDVSMGGRVAEELILVYGSDNVSSGASSDIRHATRTAQAMVKQWGFSKLGPIFYDDRDTSVSPRRREQIEEEVTNLVRGGESRATALLTSKIDELHRLARALVEHETLNLEEVEKVVKGEPIRNITEVLEEEISNIESQS
ncbi:ATP-dependent peptidase [Crepidotus variabilis]|uniref:ATP-dependent peptidase n=1 Tax=Crepidotus variabilis TaxID=179855 RepID=A0A9P6EQC9_9AGAR|nr:ATP-dependent peptidase [Crepidotus variabilis]